MDGIDNNESAAKKKRRPFIVKSGEGSNNIYCLTHADEVATFYCVVCHKPYCEDCVGGERGDQTVCSPCVESKVQSEIKQDGNKHRRKLLLWWFLGGLAAVVVTTNLWMLVNYSPSSEQVLEPQVSPQVSALIECRHRLEALAEHARSFHQSMEKLPDSMEDVRLLVDDPEMLVEPVGLKPYLLSTEDGHIKIVCPEPAVHGVEALFAVPGKPAKMIFFK